MKHRAVFLDMDGTVLDNQHNISDDTIAVLQELSAKGIIIGIATGRSIANLHKYIDQLCLPQATLPLVCYNGGYGFLLNNDRSAIDKETPTVIYASPVDEHDIHDLLSLADDLGSVAQYYNGLCGDVSAVPKTSEHIDLLDRYAKLVGKRQVIIDSYDVAISRGPPAKVLLLANNVDPILQESSTRFGRDRFTIIRGSPDPYFVEFLKFGITKGEGLRKVCEHLGLSLEHVVAFGDGDNDAEMLEYVGYGCAMKNAKAPAKAAANVVLEWTNNEEGVARQLRKMIDEGCFDF